MGTIKLWHWDDNYDPYLAPMYERGHREGEMAERRRLLRELINDLQSRPTIDVLLELKGALARLDVDRNVRPVNQKGR